jgi:hypothetical protein
MSDYISDISALSEALGSTASDCRLAPGELENELQLLRGAQVISISPRYGRYSVCIGAYQNVGGPVEWINSGAGEADDLNALSAYIRSVSSNFSG